MRFYQGLLPAIVWDPTAGAPGAEFVKGVFDTEDEKLILLLQKKGYLDRADVGVLQAGGTLPHGGFERVSDDSKLPSGRPPMDNPELAGGVPHSQDTSKIKGDSLRTRSEAKELVTVSTTEAGNEVTDFTAQIAADQQKAAGKRPRAVKSETEKKPRRKIKRRDKK